MSLSVASCRDRSRPGATKVLILHAPSVPGASSAAGTIHSCGGTREGSPRLHERETLGKKLAAPVRGFGLVGDRMGKRHSTTSLGSAFLPQPSRESSTGTRGACTFLAVAKPSRATRKRSRNDTAAVVVREDQFVIRAQRPGLLQNLKAADGERHDMVALHFHASAGCRIIAGDRPGLSLPIDLIPPCLPRLGRANGRRIRNSRRAW